MRILYVANSFLEKNKPTTGLPIYLYKVSRTLLKMGHTPIIVAGGVSTGVSCIDGIEVHTIAVFHDPNETNIFINGKDILLTSYRLNKEVKSIHNKFPVDIVQYASPYGLGIFYGIDAPAVLRLSWYAKIYFYPYIRFTKSQVALFSFFERLQTKRMVSIFGPGKIIADEFGKDTNRKVKIIETPYENELEKLDYSVYNNQLLGKKYILFFGALLAEKGIFVIEKIIYNVLKENPDYYYVFAGENVVCNGEYPMNSIINAAKEYRERVIYLGRLERSKLFAIIKNANLITLPSLMENFANSCVEAMGLCKVVIGTDGATYEQLIVNGENGFLVKPNNYEELEQAIHYALKLSDKERHEIGKLAKKRVNRLRPEITVKKLYSYYEYIISHYK